MKEKFLRAFKKSLVFLGVFAIPFLASLSSLIDFNMTTLMKKAPLEGIVLLLLYTNVLFVLAIIEFKEDSDKQIIKPGKDGFYESKVIGVRKKKIYDIYKLNGVVKKYEDKSIQVVEGETHWLLYEKGQFEELREGDKVKFQIKKVDIRTEYNAGDKTRNIYPLSVRKVG